MALQIYIDDEVQDYKKQGSGDLLFGVQIAPKNKLLQIWGADWPTDDAITKIEAVRIDVSGAELSRTNLATNLIVFDTDKYIVDVSKSLASNLFYSLYYIEFTNGTIFKSEPFLVSDITA